MKNFEVLKTTTTKLGNKIELIGSKNIDFTNVSPILIIGVVHGDEPQGKILIEHFLSSNEYIKNDLLFIPCLNPDGLQLNTRTNANKVDLNRNFPTKNWILGEKDSYFGGESAGSEAETQFLIDTIEEFKPKSIITLHAPYKVVNYDGPAKELAEKISKIINYPVEESIGYPTPGSFGTYSGIERQIPTITLELDEICPVNDLIEPVNNIFKSL